MGYMKLRGDRIYRSIDIFVKVYKLYFLSSSQEKEGESNMKHFLSRSLSLLLVFALCLTIFPVTSLASEANTAEEKAQALYELGLFYGKGSNSDGTPNFALQDSATRNEAATMLIRLMGQESKAKSQLVAGTISNPFTDVPDWAKSNVA